MTTINNGESGLSVRNKLNEVINKIEGVTSIGNDVLFGDNSKAIFGAGSDLQIFSLSGNSYIYEAGTGSLIIRAADLLLRSPTDENYLVASSNGAVSLYYDDAVKLATTATGVDVTGTITSDGLDVNADSIRVRTAQTPATAGAAGNQGEIAWDADYIYVCVATDTWKRVAIATW